MPDKFAASVLTHFRGCAKLREPTGSPSAAPASKGITVADKERITDRYLKSLRPAPAGKRVEIWDKTSRGFGIRVSDTVDADPARRGRAGRITFVMYARFAPGTSSVRRTIGTYGSICWSMPGAPQANGAARSTRALILPSPSEQPAPRQPVKPPRASSMHSAPWPSSSSPTSWRRSARARSPSAICAAPSWRRGVIAPSARSPRSTCSTSSTGRNATLRRWPEH